MKLKQTLLYIEHDVYGLSVCKQQRIIWKYKVGSLVHSEPRVMFIFLVVVYQTTLPKRQIVR